MFYAPIHTPPKDMTFTALRSRADRTLVLDTVKICLGEGDDEREVTVFLTHEQDDLGEDCGYRLRAKTVIGVALCDLDDPFAEVETLTRDEAADLFGWEWIEDRESVE